MSEWGNGFEHSYCVGGQNENDCYLMIEEAYCIWCSQAYTRPPILMPVLDGFWIKLIPVFWTSALHQWFCFEVGSYFRTTAYSAGLGRDQVEYLVSPMAESKTSQSKYQRVQDNRKVSWVRNQVQVRTRVLQLCKLGSLDWLISQGHTYSYTYEYKYKYIQDTCNDHVMQLLN